jgi:hypothetical protein
LPWWTVDTTRSVVEAYLRRIKAYNGTCVNEPQGILGPITTIAHARQINALSTLNLRPAARTKWGFDARKAYPWANGAPDGPKLFKILHDNLLKAGVEIRSTAAAIVSWRKRMMLSVE